MNPSLEESGSTTDGKALPGPFDFDATNPDNLDARWAWREFGGKTIDEAYRHFSTNPFAFSEAFLFMGPTAFRYYFPVIERYINEVIPESPDDDCDLPTIGSALWGQLELTSERSHSAPFLSEIVEAAKGILNRLPRMPLADEEADHIRWEWEQVLQSVERQIALKIEEGEQDAP